MQNIIIYATASEMLAKVRDRANAKAVLAPTFAKGCAVCLKLRLFANSSDDTPYPIAQLQSIVSWSFAMDTDWDSSTTYKIVADAGQITVATVTEDGNTYTEVSIPISDTNTQQIATWLGNAESKDGLNAELIGCNATSEEVFVLQIKGFSVRNRLGSLGTPTVIDPEYLTASQVRALIASGVALQYSANGTAWHNAQAIGDNYIRFRSASDASSAWSSAIALPQGVAGEDGEDGEDGADGANAYVYIRYASDTSGSGFSPSPSNSLPYIGVISTNSEIANPTASDFVGKWVRYLGQQGASGQSAYTYVAYASSSSGANFSLTPTSGLKYRAEIHTTTEIATPTASDFTSATWVKYIGDDGQGAGDMLKAVYDINNDGVVDSATKLATARSIGSASFDGSADISLAQIGAQPALPSGTAGLYLKKTANGVEWDSPTASGGATWGSITGTLQDQSDLNTALSSKISAPASGSTGQFLQKTASGVQWANGSATTDYDTVRVAHDDSDVDDIIDYCKTHMKPCVFTVSYENTYQNMQFKTGHIYGITPLNISGEIIAVGADITRGVKLEEPEVLSGTTATVKPGRLYKYTLTGNSTLSADGGDVFAWGSSEIDIVMGAHTLTAGSNMTFATQPTSGKTNHCVVKWRGTSARLTVLDVEDSPSSGTITANAQSMSGTAGSEVSYNLVASASNGATVSFALASGQSLPSGLTLSNGTVSGTVASAVTQTVSIVASASGCANVTFQLTITISAPSGTVTATTPQILSGTAGSSCTMTLSATASTGGAVSFALASGSTLPSGLSLSGNTVSGTVASATSTSVQIVASATGCTSATITLNIEISAPVPTQVTYTYSGGDSAFYNNGTYVYDSVSNTAVCENTERGDKRRLAYVNNHWQIQVYSGGAWSSPNDYGWVVCYQLGQSSDIDSSIVGTKQWSNEQSEMAEDITITKNS